MSNFAVVKEDHIFLAKMITQIDDELTYCGWSNGYVCLREGGFIRRSTICNREVSDNDLPSIQFHTFGINVGGVELKFAITKLSDSEVDLEFLLGELTAKSFEVLKQQVLELYRKVRSKAMERRRGQKCGGLNTEAMNGLYFWRRKISKSSRYWKNYEEAVRQNIASPEFIATMKLWNLHFRDY